MSPLKHLILAAAVAATATLTAARSGTAAEGDNTAERAVSVSATGSVAAEPNVAHVSAGIVSEADTAKDALARNTTAMAKLLDGLKGLGIAPRDMQTVAFNVEPRYTQPKEERPAVISGYRVVNQVRLAVRDVKRLGEILDQAIALGANDIRSIAFDVDKAETLKDDARRQAMDNARRRADLYAKAAGAQLGPVLRIAEDVRALAAARPTSFGRAAIAAEVPIEAGTRTLEVEVHVTYVLK